MKTLVIFLVIIAFAIAMFILGTGLAMIVIGAIGHIFNITIFTLISFWESAILAVVYGALGAGAKSNS